MTSMNRRAEWLLLALALLLVGALAGYLRQVEFARVEATESAHLQGQARTVADNLAHQLLSVNHALVSLQQGFVPSAGAEQRQEVSRRLKLFGDLMPEVRTMLVLDARGKVLASNRDEQLGLDLSGRDYFKMVEARPDPDRLYVSPPFLNSLNVYSVAVGRALLGPDGRFAGLVAAGLDPEYFEVLMRSVLYASDMSGSLIHGDGQVILNQPAIAGVLGKNLRQPGSLFSRHMDSGQVATVVSGIVRVTGIPRMMAQHTLQPPGLDLSAPIVIALGRDLAGIYGPWRRQTLLYGILFVLLTAAACLGLSLSQRRRMAIEEQAALQEQERSNQELLRVAQLSYQLQLREAELRESERRLTLVAKAAKLGIWIRDIVRSQIWASDEWRALFGFSATEPVTFAEVLRRIHPEDRSVVSQFISPAPHGAAVYEAEFRIVLPDGRLRWIASRGSIEFDAEACPVLARGVSLDISARKQAEIELDQKHREVAHLSRVTMLGELSGALAHELNQPLTAILSNAQAAQRFLAQAECDPNELRDILQEIVDEDKRAGEVIRRLRLLLSPGETQRQSVCLNDTVAEVLKLLRADLLRQGIKVQTDFCPGRHQVRADLVQLQQVLINLVVNACDAMNASAEAERQLVLRTLLDGGNVCVTVMDQGAGIQDGHLERIFESFFTTKARGMGLGLSICRTILRANGGRLWAENNPGPGASFHFSLPLEPCAAP